MGSQSVYWKTLLKSSWYIEHGSISLQTMTMGPSSTFRTSVLQIIATFIKTILYNLKKSIYVYKVAKEYLCLNSVLSGSLNAMLRFHVMLTLTILNQLAKIGVCTESCLRKFYHKTLVFSARRSFMHTQLANYIYFT